MSEPQPEPSGPEPPAPDTPPPSTDDASGAIAARPIRKSDRVIALGKTGTGKSQLELHLFAKWQGQRLLVDVQDHYELGPDALAEKPEPCDADRVRDIDWRARTIRYVPRGTKRDYDDLYAAIYQRGRMMVLLDEAYGPTTAHQCPQWVRRVVTQGRKRQILHMAASQRPANILPELVSQSEHAFIFDVGGRSDDLDTIGSRLGLRGREVGELLASLERLDLDSDVTGYIRHDLGSPTLIRMPPLPADIIAATARVVINPA